MYEYIFVDRFMSAFVHFQISHINIVLSSVRSLYKQRIYLGFRIAKTNILTAPGTLLNSPFYLSFVYATIDISISQQRMHNCLMGQTNH